MYSYFGFILTALILQDQSLCLQYKLFYHLKKTSEVEWIFLKRRGASTPPWSQELSSSSVEHLSSSPSPPNTHYDSAFPQELISAWQTSA